MVSATGPVGGSFVVVLWLLFPHYDWLIQLSGVEAADVTDILLPSN